MLYFHGANKSQSEFANSPNTFWVYPLSMKLQNRWDTHHSAYAYCNNHKEDGLSAWDSSCKQYICLGHSNSADLELAEAEWIRNYISNIPKEEQILLAEQEVVQLRERLLSKEATIDRLKTSLANKPSIMDLYVIVMLYIICTLSIITLHLLFKQDPLQPLLPAP